MSRNDCPEDTNRQCRMTSETSRNMCPRESRENLLLSLSSVSPRWNRTLIVGSDRRGFGRIRLRRISPVNLVRKSSTDEVRVCRYYSEGRILNFRVARHPAGISIRTRRQLFRIRLREGANPEFSPLPWPAKACSPGLIAPLHPVVGPPAPADCGAEGWGLEESRLVRFRDRFR